MYSLQNFDLDIFLRDYWQKKPLLIKQGLQHFTDPLDEHELAGLALEDSIDSRIISRDKQSWQVSHGPFNDINQQCVGAWSLLVQKVDQYIPQADELMRAFSFIPSWRMTDLMVSFSNADAGVGPHIDQYDVFIIQGKGSRRWQVGLPGKHSEYLPHPELKQISPFTPLIDEILTAGDIIYIPPHHPHNGIALEDCMNYSVGFRAPSEQEMLTSFADYALEHNLFSQRYKDKSIAPRVYPGEIKQQELNHFKHLLSSTIASTHFEQWLGQYLSETNRSSHMEVGEGESYSEEEINDLLAEGIYFTREPGIKAIFIENQASDNTDFTFYIDSQTYTVELKYREFVTHFLNSPAFSIELQQLPENGLFFTPLLTKLVNSGFWLPE
jgi:50S ribosomal protein L16 3-hydroxylase